MLLFAVLVIVLALILIKEIKEMKILTLSALFFIEINLLSWFIFKEKI